MPYFSTFRAPYLGTILDPFWAIFGYYWISLKWCSGNNWSKITNDRTECVFILVHFTVFGHFYKHVYFEVFWTTFEHHFRHLIYAIILMYLGPYLGIILDPFMVGKSCHKKHQSMAIYGHTSRIGESTSSMAFESVDHLFSSVMYVVRTQSRPT